MGGSQSWRIWRPATWWRGQAETFEGEPLPSIPELCPAVRALILNTLELRDLKTMSQVCRSLKVDVDEDLVGVSVTFQPSEPKPGLIARALNYFSRKGPGEKNEAKAREMLTWLGKVTVKSLNIRRLPIFPIQPASLKHPLRLRRLVLDFDEENIPPESGLRVSEMLNLFGNLEILSITCCAPYRLTTHEEVDVYRAALSSLLEKVRLGLRFKPNLKEVSVVVNSRLLEIFAGWLATVEDVQDLPLGPNFPRALRKLELHLPDHLYPEKSSNWKSLLDGQEQLEWLKVNCGNVYFKGYFMTLQKNVQSLRHLDLYFSYALNNDQLSNATVPQDQWLDWNELAAAENLESLTINLSGHGNQCPGLARFRSLNFLTFDLPHLQRLELKYIFMLEAELQKIFFGLQSLQNVVLEYWSHDKEASDEGARTVVLIETVERARYTCDILVKALSLNRFESIHMTDYMIYRYPKFLRDRILKLPNYSVTWPDWWMGSLVITKT